MRTLPLAAAATQRVKRGAKAIPEGGYWALPTLHAPGMVICGDAGGMVNVPKLKGIHYAIESGRLAAEAAFAAAERDGEQQRDFIYVKDAVDMTLHVAAQPSLGDYLGIPFNDAGRMRSDTTAESIWGYAPAGIFAYSHLTGGYAGSTLHR